MTWLFQKFLAQNIDKRKMASMIYGVSRNEKRGLGYVSTKHFMANPKSKQKATKPKALYSHFTNGHTHDYATQKSQVNKKSKKTNKKGPKRYEYLKIE